MSKFEFVGDVDYASIGGLRLQRDLVVKIKAIANKEGASIRNSLHSLLKYAVDSYEETFGLTGKDLEIASRRMFRPKKAPTGVTAMRNETKPEEYASIEAAMEALSKEEEQHGE